MTPIVAPFPSLFLPGLLCCYSSLLSSHPLTWASHSVLWSDNFDDIAAAAAAAKSLQLCLTLCDPIEGSPPGSPVPGILQARTLEWGAIAFSNAGKWKVKVKSLSHVRLLATPWTAAHQAPSSMGFSRQEYWSGVPLPSLRMFSTHFQFVKAWLRWNGSFSASWAKDTNTFFSIPPPLC